MGKLIPQCETTVQRIDLLHPVEGCPASARQVGYYMSNGRTIGLKLEFPGGHVASLTFGEIRDLQQDLRNFSE